MQFAKSGEKERIMKNFLSLACVIATSVSSIGFANEQQQVVAPERDANATIENHNHNNYCGEIRYEWSQYDQVQFCFLTESVWAPRLGQCEWNRRYVVDAWNCR